MMSRKPAVIRDDDNRWAGLSSARRVTLEPATKEHPDRFVILPRFSDRVHLVSDPERVEAIKTWLKGLALEEADD